MGREDLAARIRDYFETVSGCDARDIETACKALAKVDSPFLPSAGQLYSAAQRAAADRVQAERDTGAPRLAPRENNPTPAERERIGHGLAALKAELLAANAMDRLRGRA